MAAQSKGQHTHVAFANDLTPAANQLLPELFMRRERRRLQARHIWVAIQPDQDTGLDQAC